MFTTLWNVRIFGKIFLTEVGDLTSHYPLYALLPLRQLQTSLVSCSCPLFDNSLQMFVFSQKVGRILFLKKGGNLFICGLMLLTCFTGKNLIKFFRKKLEILEQINLQCTENLIWRLHQKSYLTSCTGKIIWRGAPENLIWCRALEKLFDVVYRKFYLTFCSQFDNFFSAVEHVKIS